MQVTVPTHSEKSTSNMWKYSGVFLVALLALFPLSASAVMIAELQAQLQSLLTQVAALQAQSNVAAPQSGAASCPNLMRNLSRDMRGNDVVQLQQFLISQNLLTAGNSTGYFGRLTETAVKKFQCKNMNICSGSPSTNGYGSVGPRTRAAIATTCKVAIVTPPTNPPAAPPPTTAPPVVPSNPPIIPPPVVVPTPTPQAPAPPFPTPAHRPLVGVYYFGMFSPALLTDSSHAPHDRRMPATTATLTWWQGVDDFFKKTGTAYNLWEQRTPTLMDFSDKKPLIGYYDQTDVHVVEQHIDQAAAASVDFFNFYWYWNQRTHAAAYADGLKSFRKASNKAKMRFMLSIYTSSWDPDLKIPSSDFAAVRKDLIDDFSDPAYLRFNSRPLLYMGDVRGLGDGTNATLASFVNDLKKDAVQRGFPEPVVLITPGAEDGWELATTDGFFCLTPGTQTVTGGDDYDGFLSRIDGFYSMLGQYGKPIAPCAASNIDERPRQIFDVDPNLIRYYANFTPYKFYQGLQKVRAWQEGHQSSLSDVLSIYAWNEWHEGGIIEPNVRDGTLYLDLIQRAFRTIVLNRYSGTTADMGHRVTTQTLQSSWKFEGNWRIFKEQDGKQSRVPIYECQSGAHYFVSRDTSCEGGSMTSTLGYLARGQYDLQGLVPLYSCTLGADRFVSSAADCEKSSSPSLDISTIGLLGYAFPY